MAGLLEHVGETLAREASLTEQAGMRLPAAIEGAIEIGHGRLYWADVPELPKDTATYHFFSMQELTAGQPIEEVGPPDLGMVCSYCSLLDGKLKDAELQSKALVHCCSSTGHGRTYEASLLCAYQVLVAGRRPMHALWPFQGIQPPLALFGSGDESDFCVSITDVVEALVCAEERRWLIWNQFDVESFDHFSLPENGGMNWIIPGKLLAFAEPSSTPVRGDGSRVLPTKDYAKLFKDAGIGLVVRTNKPAYDKQPFADAGVRHVDLYIPEGESPSGAVVSAFLRLVEAEEAAVAVHCSTGFERTCTLIGLYAMRRYAFPARSLVAWCLMCRPDSLGSRAQHFLLGSEGDGPAGSEAKTRALHTPTNSVASTRTRLPAIDEVPSGSFGCCAQGENSSEASDRPMGGSPDAKPLWSGLRGEPAHLRPEQRLACPGCCPGNPRGKWTDLLPAASTTVMVRNIPGRYKQKELMREFEELGLQGTFNFFYLPSGRSGLLNAGYAFLNFISRECVIEGLETLDGHRFRKHQHDATRFAAVSLARTQGLEENTRLRSKAFARSTRAKKQRAAERAADVQAATAKKVPMQAAQ